MKIKIVGFYIQYFNNSILMQEDYKRIISLQKERRNTLFFVMKVKNSIFIWKNNYKSTVPEENDFNLKNYKLN